MQRPARVGQTGHTHRCVKSAHSAQAWRAVDARDAWNVVRIHHVYAKVHVPRQQ